MSAGFLSETNSWHWLGAAVAAAAVVSAFLWRAEIRRVGAEHAPQRVRQAKHLAELRALDAAQAEALDRQAEALRGRLETLRAEVAEAGFAPVPEGADAVMAVKNAVDRTLTDRGLRIVSSAVRVAAPAPARGAAPKAAAKATPAKRVSADEYAREVQRTAAGLDKSLREEFLRDAQQKLAKLRAAEARQAKAEAKAAARAAKAAPAAPQAAPAKLPFATEDVAYVVEGDFREMFLFLVGETFRKPSHHLDDLSVTRPQGAAAGPARMAFTLRINHR